MTSFTTLCCSRIVDGAPGLLETGRKQTSERCKAVAKPSGPRHESVLGAAIGLSEGEENLYRHLLEHPSETVTEIASESELTERRARELVTSLEVQGLVSHTPRRPPRYRAADPKTALELLLLRKQEDVLRQQSTLEQARRIVEELATVYRASAHGGSPREPVEVLTGYAPVLQRMDHEMQHAEREILALGKSPVRTPPPELTEMKIALARRGVQSRVVYEPDTLQVPGQVEFIETVAAVGEETRIASDLPTRLIIVDGKVALTPLQIDRWDEWLLVRSPSLLHAFLVMFETIWASAAPFPPLPAEEVTAAPAGVELAPDDQRLLVLLARGAEEYDIADRLDVTPRTIDRRVKRIMDALGVRTRFQLGLALSRGGWMMMLPNGEER